MKFYFTPTKRGLEKVLAMLKGSIKSFGVVFMLELVLAILKLVGGGGAQNGSDPRFPNFVAPPPPSP